MCDNCFILKRNKTIANFRESLCFFADAYQKF